MNPHPLVTIICLCYNHERFLAEALDSVLAQTYANLEIIVVDDCSTDGSVAVIERYLQRHPRLRFVSTGKNRGNCTAFNLGWRLSKGEFVIDFATDDVLYLERVAEQVQAFRQVGESYGVVYTDALLIDEQSRPVRHHFRRDRQGNLQAFAPSGNVFAHLLRRYFISPPTMMMRREVLEALNGYDESLAYEDFDFWVRSSRHFKYMYLDKVLTKRRVHANSLSRKVYKKGDLQLASTVKVCRKAAALVRTEAERQALVARLNYELRHAVLTENFEEAASLMKLLDEQTNLTWQHALWEFAIQKRVKLRPLWKAYQYLRYRKS